MTETLYNAIGWTLLHAIWQISLVAFLVYLVLNAEWIKTPNKRYLTISFAFGALGILTLLTFFYYYDPTSPSAFYKYDIAKPILDSQSKPDNATPFLINWLNNKLVYLTFTWISGFILYSVKLLGGFTYLSILRKNAVQVSDPTIIDFINRILEQSGKKKKIKVLISQKILSPVTFGIYRASIVVPAAYFNQLSTEETEVILAHELAHILRYDYLVNVIVSLIKTTFYFHPGIWWLSNQLATEREKATDELACKLCHADSIQYAKSLLKAQQILCRQESYQDFKHSANALAIPFWKSKKQLLGRIEHLLGTSKRNNPWIHRMITLLLFLGIFSFLSFTQIILPRSGAMAHPALEAESMKNTENIEVETIVEQIETDSITVQMNIKVDQNIVETGSSGNIINNTNSKDPKTNVTETEKEVKLFIVRDSIEKTGEIHEFIIDHANDNRKIDTLVNHNRILMLKPDHNREIIIEKFYEKELTSDQLEKLIVENEEIEFRFPEAFKQVKWYDSSIQKLRKEHSKIDSISHHWIHRFKEDKNMNFTWEFIPEQNPFFNHGDSIIHQYKLDKDLIDNLKMEGLEHIEEFRFRNFPVDENRITKILYIES
jgi:beta-lactamase regulating signal transducer with metallopeptidase domain